MSAKIALTGWLTLACLLPSLSGAETLGILCFGDSLTAGLGAPVAESYPAVLSRLTGCKVSNAGRVGNTSSDALKRAPALAAVHKGNLVIIALGGNDHLQQIPLRNTRRNIGRIIKIFQSRGCRVVLLGLPGRLHEQSLGCLARKHGIVFAPTVFDGIWGDSQYMNGTLHLNGKGYRLLADRVVMLIGDIHPQYLCRPEIERTTRNLSTPPSCLLPCR